MHTALSKMAAICLVAAATHGSRPLTPMGQEADTQRPATQPSSPETTPQVEMKFDLVKMSHGFTKNGFLISGRTYKTANQVMVYVAIVHLVSREGAKKEYDDRLKEALRIIEQGKVDDKPATKPATTEDRAVIVVPSTEKDCKEMFSILATAGTVLRIQQSCSLDAVVAWEKLARRNESVRDRFVSR
jgi:hypothetical protein